MKNRNLKLRAWLLALDRFERQLLVKIARERNRFIKSIDNNLITSEIFRKHKNNINDVLTAHYFKVAPYFGSLVLNQVKSKKLTMQQKRMSMHTSYMLEWLKTEALRKATMIADTDRSDVQSVIEQGVIDGVGSEQVARNIRKITALTPHRAATIARTETSNAATFASVETARAAEEDVGIVLLKKWLPTMDNRTRESHRAMADSESIPLNEKFMVDGEMLDRPCDTAGSAENVINCRCAIIFEEKE